MSDLVVPPAGQPAPSSWLCLHGCSSQSASYQRQQEVPPRRAQRGFQSGSLPGKGAVGSSCPLTHHLWQPLSTPCSRQETQQHFRCSQDCFPVLCCYSVVTGNGNLKMEEKRKFPCERQQNWAPITQLSPTPCLSFPHDPALIF